MRQQRRRLAHFALVARRHAGQPARKGAARMEIPFRRRDDAVMRHPLAIEGRAEVVEDPDTALMAAIARRYLGDELPTWMNQRMEAGDRVVLRITPRRVRPWNIAALPE